MSDVCPACKSAKLLDKSRIGKSRNYTSKEYWQVCSSCDFSRLVREENRHKVWPENPQSEWTFENMTKFD